MFGSLNMDLVQRVSRLPSMGETIQGDDLRMLSGGKGANQACAAARLGGTVALLGKVGDDAFGAQLKSDLQKAGVNIDKVAVSRRATGVATILVLPDGANLIVISPGANADIDPETAVSAIEDASAEDLLLCQLETPLEANLAVLRAARRRRMIAILDPAPARILPTDLLEQVSILTPNQSEAFALLGKPLLEISSLMEARELARALCQRGPDTVILKLGALGCLVAQADSFREIPGHAVPVVDSTGAGDIFNGALAVAISEGKPINDAARFANAAAAISVTQFGAMNSTPTFSALNQFLIEIDSATQPDGEKSCSR